jgi:hypothetical protein
MKFRRTPHFKKCFEALPADIKERTRECFKLFQEAPYHPYHPSLRIKPMRGPTHIWEGHITRAYVFTFHRETDPQTGELIIVFRKIGTHEIYRNP